MQILVIEDLTSRHLHLHTDDLFARPPSSVPAGEEEITRTLLKYKSDKQAVGDEVETVSREEMMVVVIRKVF